MEKVATTDKITSKEFVLTQELDAPQELVFKAWTEPDRLAEWWGPKGFKIEVKKLNLEPGGLFHYNMQAGDGPKMWGRFEFRKIQAPEKIVFVNAFSDENGGITRAPFADTWPMEMLNTVTLSENNGKTLLTLTGGALNATEAESNTYNEGFESMRQGFSGTFEQLKAYLAKVQQ